MEILLSGLICILCFVCGAWAAKGFELPRKKQGGKESDVQKDNDDVLSRDIAAMLAYTVCGKEEIDEES